MTPYDRAIKAGLDWKRIIMKATGGSESTADRILELAHAQGLFGHFVIPKAEVVGVFSLGDKVEKRSGDYFFPGEIRAVVVKKSGVIRYVAEDDRGSLHIFRAEQLTEV